jgi:uncharacterized repeat protein (TIGR03803 family)
MKRGQSLFSAAVSKALAATTLTLIVALILAPSAWAAGRYKVLYKFTGGNDGSQPYAGLILDASGNLYGTTTQGGPSGNGTVFKLTKNSDGSWTESVLYSFAGGTDGAMPQAEVTFDAIGNLYGTTYYGGAFSAGVVFQLAPNSGGTWTETLLYSFTGGSDGANPSAGVIFDASGNLYGATYLGGASGDGVVYKLTPTSGGTWTESVLHTFTGQDGSNPELQKLTFDTTGNLYGSAEYGGGSGSGVVYRLTPNSDGTWSESVLYTFTGGNDGAEPAGSLTFDSAGRLYGTTQSGNDGLGGVFKLTPGAKGKWHERVLYMFHGNQDGAYPLSGVVFDTTGNLYGTTNAGINSHGGVGQLFKLVPHRGLWKKYVPHYFEGPPRDGGDSLAPVVFDAAGNLYGTAYDGWNTGCCGVVFEYIK